MKGSVFGDEVELASSTNADRLRLTLLDERRGSDRGPLRTREVASRFADGVGAVTMTLVGPFIMTFTSFCFGADTSLKEFTASGASKLAGK